MRQSDHERFQSICKVAKGHHLDRSGSQENLFRCNFQNLGKVFSLHNKAFLTSSQQAIGKIKFVKVSLNSIRETERIAKVRERRSKRFYLFIKYDTLGPRRWSDCEQGRFVTEKSWVRFLLSPIFFKNMVFYFCLVPSYS